MPGTKTPYIIKQGDYLTKLAFVLGFDADEVWNDPKNADLKSTRPDPDVLAPGDVLYVPEKADQPLPLQAGTSNQFSATVPPIDVVVVFLDDDNPLANEPCQVSGLGDGADAPPTSTDGDGKLTLKVPLTVREFSVQFPQRDLAYQVGMGDLDPDSEASGIKQRLTNLGFLPAAPEGTVDEDEQATLLKIALSAFQEKNGLTSTGQIDDATRQALVAKHEI